MILFLPVFLFLLPLGSRLLLFTFTPGFHEYEAVFVYGLDFLLLLLLAYGFLRPRTEKLSPLLLLTLFLFLGSSLASVFFSSLPFLSLYRFARLFAAVGLGLCVFNYLRENTGRLRFVLLAILISGLLQSAIGIAQFSLQGGVGFSLLGEPTLGVDLPGIAKMDIGGTKLLRAYGTFPHPNVLGAYLLLCIIALLVLFFSLQKKTLLLSLLFGAALFILLFGLLVTFSRGAYIATFVSVAFFLVKEMRMKSRRGIWIVAGVTLLLLVSFPLFRPYLGPRLRITRNDPSVSLRLSYAQLGLRELVAHPEGVGMGSQVVSSVLRGSYVREGLTRPWQWEPIHNLFLLAAVEIGVVGGVALLALFGMLLILLWRSNSVLSSVGLSMMVGLFFVGLLDHFLWTLVPGQLMLWSAIGIGLAGIEKSSALSRNFTR